MPTYYTYVSAKVSDDDVEAAVEKAREAAASKLGCKDASELRLLESSWTHEYVYTRWTWLVEPPAPPS